MWGNITVWSSGDTMRMGFRICVFVVRGNIVVWSSGDTGWVGGSGAGGNNRASA